MRITIVGDALLDVDLIGTADRLSPDAPVPVLSVADRRDRPGGAGLAAVLASRAGAEVTLITCLGQDPAADRLRNLLEQDDHLSVVAARTTAPTAVKTRVRTRDQAIARIDQGASAPTPPTVDDAMVEALATADAIVVSDYGRGLAADPRMRRALEDAGRRVPLVWDPHQRGPAPVATAAVATPNLEEALNASGSSGVGIAGAAAAASILAQSWRLPAVLVTLGGHGALLHRTGAVSTAPHVVPTTPLPSVDTCGAGDRLAVELAMRLAVGEDLATAADSAVNAARRFLAAGGVTRLSEADGQAGEGNEEAWTRARRAGGVVVATGGCFDLLHSGHARTLAAARALGDCLVVCLNSDASVRRLKGSQRPIMSQDDRRELLMALACVDAVVVFDEDTPEDVLRRIRPDIWVKGGDYIAELLPEAEVVQEWGGTCVTVPYHPGRSTTALAAAVAAFG